MGITRATVATVEALATWMQENAVPGIFKSVTYSDSVLTATDANDDTVLTINGGNGAGSSGFFRAYRGSENYLGFALNLLPDTTAISIIGCDNGFIFEANLRNAPSGAQRLFAVLIAKTQLDKVAIIFPSTPPSSSPQQYTTALNHVAFGDSATESSTTTFTPESAQQTIMCTFGTNADITDVSYTPKAFYMPIHSAYNQGIGKFLCGGKVYITNGYWCIDTEQTEEDAT